MIDITGFEVSGEIHSSRRNKIYRGLRQEDRKPVVIKVLNDEYPSLEELNKFQYEYEVVSKLQQIDGVIDHYQVVDYGNTKAIVMEDYNGLSVDHLIENGMALKTFFHLAVELVDILAQIHSESCIHKDIKPHNILYNLQTGQVKVIDFSISYQLSRVNQTVINPERRPGG